MKDSAVKITVTGRSGRESLDSVTTCASGRLYSKGGKRYLLYELPDESNPGTIVKHMMIFCSRHLEITKSAPGLKTRILYEPGASTETDYSTPYGSLTLVFSTKSMTVTENEKRLEIEIAYDIVSGGEPLSENLLLIDCVSE